MFKSQISNRVDSLTQIDWANAQWVGWPLALGSVMATSIITPLARGLILGGMHPAFLLSIRLIITSVLLISTFAILSPRKLRLDRKGFLTVSGIGLIGGFEICCFFWSLSWLDSSIAAMLKTIQPLAVLLLLRLGGEPLTLRHGVRLLLAIGGVYLLVGPGGSVAPMGIVLIALSIVLYALQIVFTQWYLGPYPSTTVTTYMLVTMNVVVLLWWGGLDIGWYNPGINGWIILIVLAVVSTYFARLALYAAIPRIGSGQISLLWPVQMFLAVILSVIFLQEELSIIQWLGGSLILSSAILAIEKLRI
ncbi:MAG: DMT family transporter [Chloroflexota bacterium]